MKKSVCLVLLLAVVCIVHAQLSATDSVRYYEKQLGLFYRSYYDSLRQDTRYLTLLESLKRTRGGSDNYSGFLLYTQFSSAAFKQFNADNTQSGFGSISGPVTGIGIGFSGKKNRRIFDLNIATVGFDKKTKKGDEKITTSFSTLFQFEWGYDFIKSRKVNLYPFAGFGFRETDVTYKANVQPNSSAVNVATAILNDRSTRDESTEFGYQAGIGFEYVLSKKERAGGTIIFLKAGTNRPFKKGRFDIAGYQYNPQFNYGEWTTTVGFKFFGR